MSKQPWVTFGTTPCLARTDRLDEDGCTGKPKPDRELARKVGRALTVEARQ